MDIYCCSVASKKDVLKPSDVPFESFRIKLFNTLRFFLSRLKDNLLTVDTPMIGIHTHVHALIELSSALLGKTLNYILST